MKFLTTQPLVPPYIHLGSICLVLPDRNPQSSASVRCVDAEWKALCAKVAGNTMELRAIAKRMDERGADPNYTDAPHETFFTVTDIGSGQSRIDFFV